MARIQCILLLISVMWVTLTAGGRRRSSYSVCSSPRINRENLILCIRGKPFQVRGTVGFQPPATCAEEEAPVTTAIAMLRRKGILIGERNQTIPYNIKVVIRFEQLNAFETRITAEFKGVAPFFADSTMLATHVHMYGEINADCSSTGAHYQPCGLDHSDEPLDAKRHIGDIINETLKPGRDVVTVDQIDTRVKLSGPLSILGRSITVHAGVSQARVGCAIIGVANPERRGY